jgi:pimeloyl-ACP methyl ester carboxylesterase
VAFSDVREERAKKTALTFKPEIDLIMMPMSVPNKMQGAWLLFSLLVFLGSTVPVFGDDITTSRPPPPPQQQQQQQRIPRRPRSIPRRMDSNQFVPAHHYEDEASSSIPHMSIANMTCDFVTQPLDHFVPRGKSPTFKQRYCVYDGYASKDAQATASPIFFYTGNESPLEQYINHTGLMWELAPQFQARIVFAEHRYEGESLPPANLTQNCMAYGSTIQALADYADLLQRHLNSPNTDNVIAPVIVFGGSYGGMLSAWMRMKYPHLVAGAIAASAPIGGFPQVANRKIDGAARVLQHGLQQSYPPDKHQKKEVVVDEKEQQQEREEINHCGSNLLATWPLITWLVQKNQNRNHYDNNEDNDEDDDPSTFLQTVFRLCEPYEDSDPEPLIEFATSLWFDLAEGSFPYPSSYIPFALLHKKVNLPAWPLQAACWHSGLHQDWGITYDDGDDNDQAVHYTISYGDGNLQLQIDWDNATLAASSSSSSSSFSSNTTARSLSTSKDIVGLLTSVREAIGIWHNVTKDVQCYNVSDAAPNTNSRAAGFFHQTTATEAAPTRRVSSRMERTLRHSSQHGKQQEGIQHATTSPAQTCQDKIKQVGSWEAVCCNDEMNLVITEAQGLGHDFFWPPSLPRGVNTYRQMMENVTLGPCPDPDGIFGYSTENYDPWSTWLDTYYGSSRMSGHSNIIFSNGLLDPWAAGGVYAKNPFDDPNNFDSSSKSAAMMVQNITDSDVIAVLIEYGGHHTDLMYTHKLDPECVTKAREIETKYISKWIHEWRSSAQQCDGPHKG